MAKTRDNYQIAGQTLDEVTRTLNFILQRMADRIDKIEGIRGTASIESNLEMNSNKVTELASGTASTDAATVAATILADPLLAIGGLSFAANQIPLFTAPTTASPVNVTAAGQALIDDADAAAQRTTLGLGTAATQNTGTSGANVPLLNGTNVHASGNFTAFGVGTTATQQAANADTSGATLAALETEVNELKAVLRTFGLIAT